MVPIVSKKVDGISSGPREFVMSVSSRIDLISFFGVAKLFKVGAPSGLSWVQSKEFGCE